MGIEGKDLTAIVDMQRIKYINELNLGLLQEFEWSIRYPEYVQFLTSLDGKTYTELDLKGIYEPFEAGDSTKYNAITKEKDIAARYIKLVIKNGGTGKQSGYASWFFMDELDINYIDKRVTEEWMKKRIYFKLQQKIGDKNAQN